MADTQENLITIDENKTRLLVTHKLLGGPIKKTDLFNWVLQESGAFSTPTLKDDMIIKSTVGSIVSKMVDDGMAYKKNGNIVPTPSLSKNGKITRGKTEFLRKIHNLGGAFFEEYTVRLLEKYYALIGCKVITAFRSGGSNDGGIDGILKIEDQLGFVDTVYIQCKNRSSDNTVTTKEVREFYGAMTAMQGTRGIYATTASFHCEAEKFLNSLYNCVGIDGDVIYRLALKTQYGLIGTGSDVKIDETVIKPL